MPNQLALHDVHRALGATFGDLDGWQVPLRYGDVGSEQRAIRDGAAIVDRSMLGKVTVTGRDRQAFLQGMLTNDVKKLAPGQGAPAAFLDAHGKVMALMRVYALEDTVWIELPSSLTEKTLERLDHFLISEKAYFEAADSTFAIVAVQGARARELLSALSGNALALGPHEHVEVEIAGTPVRVIDRREGSVPGFHCWTAAEHGAALWQALAGAGAVPAGMEALDALRVEGGVPWYGHDVDESHIFPEARLDDFVSFTKGCYIGQETVARVKYRGHVNRALSGLVLDGDRVPAAGARVVAEGKDVGRVTSAVPSPTLGKPIALGYVRREHFEPGTAVEIDDAGVAIPARIAALPFVEPAP
jgi:folate-binding protein YgfZ